MVVTINGSNDYRPAGASQESRLEFCPESRRESATECAGKAEGDASCWRRGVEKGSQSIGGLARLVRGQESGARGNRGWIFSSGKRRQSPGGRAGLDEVAEDPQDLLGIGNDGEDPHLGTAGGTAQRALLFLAIRSTSYTFASSRAQAEQDSLTDTD